MKVFAVLFLAALASAEIDWSKVKNVEDMEWFWVGRDPSLYRSYASNPRQGRIVNGEIASPHQFPYQVRSKNNFLRHKNNFELFQRPPCWQPLDRASASAVLLPSPPLPPSPLLIALTAPPCLLSSFSVPSTDESMSPTNSEESSLHRLAGRLAFTNIKNKRSFFYFYLYLFT